MPFLAVFLDGKIYIFLHYRFFSSFLDCKINYFKMLYNNFFFYKTYKRVKVTRKNIGII